MTSPQEISRIHERVREIGERLDVIETRLEQLFEHLDLEPRRATGGGGWWGGGGDPESGEVSDRVRELLAAGSEIEAVKVYREETGVGLKEAKEAIDRAKAGG